MDPETPVVHLAPADQPASVYQIAEGLLSAYTVDGGKVHLAGCQLEDRPFVRLTFRQGETTEEVFLDADGRPAADPLLDVLGVRLAVRLERAPAEAGVRGLAERGAEAAAQRFGWLHPRVPEEVAAVWCKHVEGKLRFTIGPYTADLPFAGWARTLAPPPYVCPHTGSPTFHLAATDDGRILDAAAVGRCEVTGRRLEADALVACSWTGKRAAPDLIERCSLSGQPVLCSEMATCETCRQRTSPAVVQGGLCSACRGLRPVSKADPRMARVLTEHPRLDRWRAWQLSETETVYVLVARGLLRKLLAVVDKESLDIKLLATGSRLTRHWRPVEPQQYPFVLRE